MVWWYPLSLKKWGGGNIKADVGIHLTPTRNPKELLQEHMRKQLEYSAKCHLKNIVYKFCLDLYVSDL
jgi:hypothetical protein